MGVFFLNSTILLFAHQPSFHRNQIMSTSPLHPLCHLNIPTDTYNKTRKNSNK